MEKCSTQSGYTSFLGIAVLVVNESLPLGEERFHLNSRALRIELDAKINIDPEWSLPIISKSNAIAALLRVKPQKPLQLVFQIPSWESLAALSQVLGKFLRPAIHNERFQLSVGRDTIARLDNLNLCTNFGEVECVIENIACLFDASVCP